MRSALAPATRPLLLPLLTLLTLSLAAQAGATPRKKPPTCPIVLREPPTANPRVIGGTAASAYVRSHMVSFHAQGCGAGLLSERWAVTAAHCLVKDTSTAWVGGSLSADGAPLRVNAVYTHPEFDFPKNDIALVQFTDPVPPGSRFFAVNDNPDLPVLGEFARVAGYGFTTEQDNRNTESRLYQVDVPIVATSSCKAAFGAVNSYLTPSIMESNHVCAGYANGKCDSCTADSGGPLFVNGKGDVAVQIAIVSFGYGCARPGIPGGYARLSTYVRWMRSVGAKFTTASEREPTFLSGYATPSAAPPSPSSSPTATSSAPPSAAPSTRPGGRPTTNALPAPPPAGAGASPSATPSVLGGPTGQPIPSPQPTGQNSPAPVGSGPSRPEPDDPIGEVTASPEAGDDSGGGGSGNGVSANAEDGIETGIDGSGGGGVNAGAAAGGAVGGFVLLALLAGVVFYARQNAGGRQEPAAELGSGVDVPQDAIL